MQNFKLSSEHSPSLEHPEDGDNGNHHHNEDKSPYPRRVAEEVSETDVHTEEARDQGRRHKHQGYEGEHLHNLVLVQVDDTEDCVLKVLETLKTEVGVVDE